MCFRPKNNNHNNKTKNCFSLINICLWYGLEIFYNYSNLSYHNDDKEEIKISNRISLTLTSTCPTPVRKRKNLPRPNSLFL